MNQNELNRISGALLKWYEIHKRDLPWRSDRDPYKILLSEVILQQTRVEQGLPYFHKFIERFPSIRQLANASEEEILRTWQGLGYYSRARNLHKCAKIIVEEFNGVIPAEREVLLTLPGIGPYTSAAIASFAFKKKEAVVDGNVIRVISRLYGIEGDIRAQSTVKQITGIAEQLIPESDLGTFNQAIMEFGALHCQPTNPQCSSCGFFDLCVARLKGIQGKVPFKSKMQKKRTRYFHYLIVDIKGKYLLRKRTEKDIWQGLFEFILIETGSPKTFEQLELPAPLADNKSWQLDEESGSYKHLLSHQTIRCKFYRITTSADFNDNPDAWPGYRTYSMEEIHNLPKSILIDRYLREKII